MKKLLLTLSTVTCLFVAAQAQQMTPEQQKAYMAYSMPGDMQNMIAKWNGDWKEDIKMWMAPGAQPMSNTSSCHNEMILGGRYQHSTHTGTFMNMPFNGESMVGYDNARKVFFMTWVDNMGTGLMYMEGKWLEPNKKIEFKGEETNPETGKKMPVRETLTIIDEANQMIEMWMTEKGKEFKSMEIKFSRS